MPDTMRDFPAIMFDPTTTVPVIIPAFDYEDATRAAYSVTRPGELWHGFDAIVLDRPTDH